MSQEFIADINAALKTCSEVLLRGYTSKYECLSANALLTSKHKKDRCQEHTRELARVARKSAGEVFCSFLFEKVDAAMKAA